MGSILGAVTLAHDFISRHVSEGAVCIDATAGRGNDTVFLCSLVGEKGRVVAFDIQEEAVSSTKELLKERGYDGIGDVHLDSHANMASYVDDKVDCIVFNFGWLPGGNHNVFTKPATSIEAIEKGLELLKERGIMSLSIYYGRETGFEERDAILSYLRTIDAGKYTVIVSEFANRPNCPPISVFILKAVEL